MPRKYYKVVRRLQGHLVSCIVGGRAEIFYSEDKFIKAPKEYAEQGYHICLFKDIKLAFLLADQCNGEIWEVTARIVHKTSVPMCEISTIDTGPCFIHTRSPNIFWSTGYMAESIKLKKLIREE